MAKDRYDKSTDDFLLRHDLANPEVEWVPPQELPDLRRYQTLAIDLECRDPNIASMGPGWATGDGDVIGVAVAAGEFRGYYPIGHANGPNLDRRMVLRWLGDHMRLEHSTKVMHNALYDLGWLKRVGIEVKGTVIDTMVAAPLVDENRRSYSLDNLARDYLSIRKDEKTLRLGAAEWGVDPKAEMWKLPARYVGGYAEQDAVVTLRLWERLRAEIEAQDLWSIFDLESRLIPMLVEMRWRGVRVDLDQVEKNRKALEERIKQLHARLFDVAGTAVDVWAAQSVAKVFDALGLSYPRTEAGSPSFTKQFLGACTHPVADLIVGIREAEKTSGTFLDGILRYTHNGRIHCELHPLRSDDGGTVTGRFSSSNPNLQNLPARDPFVKKLIRGVFLPEEGAQWGSFDYSSQEPRLLVHFAAMMPERIRHPSVQDIVAAYHAGTADLHQTVADMAGITRKQAKTINLGVMYGMGVGKLAESLGLSMEEAKALLATYHARVPFVKQVAEAAANKALQTGQVRTVLGRLCRFHLWEPTTFGFSQALPYEEAQRKYGQTGGGLRRAFAYKALNRAIQGSAADQIKKAMLDCWEVGGYLPLLSVHDELCFSVFDKKQVDVIRELMETGVKLMVPSKVDIALGANWGEID